MPDHAFWNTQPVVQELAEALEDGDMPQDLTSVDPAQHPDAPLPLPEKFVWTAIDPHNDSHIADLYKLLHSYYVEDTSNMFRFAYSKDLLRWWLTSPGCKPEYSLGIRIDDPGDETHERLIGYISGVVSDYTYSNSEEGETFFRPMQSIVFLCLDKKYRSLKLAPLLIQEITRRSYKNGVFHAIYTSGTPLTAPIQIANYYHRILNPIKLARIGFCTKPKAISDKEFTFFYKLPFLPTNISSCFHTCNEADIPALHDLYTEYSRKEYKFRQAYSMELFSHIVTHRKDSIHTLVYREKEREQPDAFITYYIIDTAVLAKDIKKQYPSMRNGYIYLYALRSNCNLSMNQLILALMHDMHNSGVDVCTALNVGPNPSFFSTMKFAEGSGKLNYYLFNLKWPKMALKDIGVVLI
ncbi:Glycylpeptide N-tetradecanoyltransferase [Giardia duodenalis]|uniref:Glycylpeptide N-tetradecanoyltransferase n=2 Tax=Giardia intestinalis TaxID=5741 RepID=C6LP15_GIAIB|nr:CDC72 [Giardia intestinalis ATCC 50581]ESU45787.1 Glycylpeptide N-tetradecanoyltransferase [Giardia intestinalis]